MSPGEGRLALVIGATGVAGPRLLERLVQARFRVRAISRDPPLAPSPSITWERADGEGEWAGSDGPSPDLLVHAAPLWLLPPVLPALVSRGVRRVVAVGSASGHAKAASRDHRERETARRLREAEEAVRAAGIDWTLLRPTLVWGGGRDRNVTDIARFVGRFGFFPVAGPGRGLRQPLHADDLAAACVGVVDRPATVGRAYDIGGGRALPYAEMVEEIARGLGRRPRLVHLPLPVARALLRLARSLPRYRHLSAAVADRMNEDLVSELGEARQDFGFAPRPFRFPEEPAA